MSIEEMINLEERKKALLQRLEEIIFIKESETTFVIRSISGLFTVNTITNEFNGIKSGDFMATSLNDYLNLCIGIGFFGNKQILFFLTEGNDKAVYYSTSKVDYVNSLKELQEIGAIIIA